MQTMSLFIHFVERLKASRPKWTNSWSIEHFLPDPTTFERQFLSSETGYGCKWGSIIKQKEHTLQWYTIHLISNNSRNMVSKIFQTFVADFILYYYLCVYKKKCNCCLSCSKPTLSIFFLYIFVKGIEILYVMGYFVLHCSTLIR